MILTEACKEIVPRFARNFGGVVPYAIEPLVVRLERLRVPRALGAGLVVAALVLAVAWGFYAVRDQFKEVVDALPRVAQRVGVWLGAADSAQKVQERAIARADSARGQQMAGS